MERYPAGGQPTRSSSRSRTSSRGAANTSLTARELYRRMNPALYGEPASEPDQKPMPENASPPTTAVLSLPGGLDRKIGWAIRSSYPNLPAEEARNLTRALCTIAEEAIKGDLPVVSSASAEG